MKTADVLRLELEFEHEEHRLACEEAQRACKALEAEAQKACEEAEKGHDAEKALQEAQLAAQCEA